MRAFAVLLALCLWPHHAGAAERRAAFPGPVAARVETVLDGDSFRAEAMVWPGHTVSVVIRIRGIDAPEKRAACRRERIGAGRARRALAGMIGDATVLVSNVAGAKYYGRVLADVTTLDGRPVASELLARDLVRPYDGGRRGPWCP